MKKIMIIGATSAIAMETARVFAGNGASLFLVARNQEKLDVLAQDLLARQAARVETCMADANELERHPEILKQADDAFGGLDAVLIAHGTLSDQNACQESVPLMLEEYSTNALSFLSWLTHLAGYFEKKRAGCIAAITSVAGDRGRQSNYVYGSAKAAVSTFLAGMRNRLFPAGVKVVTIKPGFVDTPMTRDYKKGPLFAQPAAVARGIHRAMLRGRGEVYLPWFWWGIMMIVRNVPEFIFKRMKM